MSETVVPFPFGNCTVCGDRATGVHYGVETCEGCKGFFKRSITKAAQYKCFFGGNCPMSPQNRNRCKSCRFRRCITAGMSLEGIKMGRIPKAQKEHALMKLGSEGNSLNGTIQKHQEPASFAEDKRNGCGGTQFTSLNHPQYLQTVGPYSSFQTGLHGQDGLAWNNWLKNGMTNQTVHNSLEVPPAEDGGGHGMFYRPGESGDSASSGSSDERGGRSPWSTEMIKTLMDQVIEHVDRGVIQQTVLDQFIISLSDRRRWPCDSGSEETPSGVFTFTAGSGSLGGSSGSTTESLLCEEKVALEDEVPLSEIASLLGPPRDFLFHNLSPQSKRSITNRLLVACRLSGHHIFSQIEEIERDLRPEVIMKGIIDPESPKAPKEEVKVVWGLLLQSCTTYSGVLSNFVVQIQGFRDLSPDTQLKVTREGIYDFWLLINYRLFRNGDYHGLLSDGRKYCRYWMQNFLPKSLINRFITFSADMQNIGFLTDAELTLLVVTQLTRPGKFSSEEPVDTDLQALHTFYTNLLIDEVMHHRSQDGGRLLSQIFELMPELISICVQQKEAIGNLDVDF